MDYPTLWLASVHRCQKVQQPLNFGRYLRGDDGASGFDNRTERVRSDVGRAVNNDVHPPEALNRGVDRRVDLGGVGEVCLHDE